MFCYKFFFHQSKKFLVIEGIFLVIIFTLKEEISCQKKKVLVRGGNFLPKEEIFCQRKRSLVKE